MTKDELKALGKSILSILIKKSHRCHFKCKYTQRKGTHKCEWLRRIWDWKRQSMWRHLVTQHIKSIGWEMSLREKEQINLLKFRLWTPPRLNRGWKLMMQAQTERNPPQHPSSWQGSHLEHPTRLPTTWGKTLKKKNKGLDQEEHLPTARARSSTAATPTKSCSPASRTHHNWTRILISMSFLFLKLIHKPSTTDHRRLSQCTPGTLTF